MPAAKLIAVEMFVQDAFGGRGDRPVLLRDDQHQRIAILG